MCIFFPTARKVAANFGIGRVFEILMKNFKDPSDAEVRRDFPGGWKEDAQNKFLATNRTAQENEAFDFVKTLANYRKGSTALQTGKLTQYLPQNGIYAYFRSDESSTVMIVMSQSDKEQTLDTQRFAENMLTFNKGKNILTGAAISNLDKLVVPANSIQVIELK